MELGRERERDRQTDRQTDGLPHPSDMHVMCSVQIMDINSSTVQQKHQPVVCVPGCRHYTLCLSVTMFTNKATLGLSEIDVFTTCR